MNATEESLAADLRQPTATARGWTAPARTARRWLYVGLGLGFVGLAALGAALPILPTTPFLLLASWFFVRSSPRLQAWLRSLPTFGPALRAWEEHRAVSPRAKATACIMIPVMLGASAYLAGPSWPVLAALGILGGIGLLVVLRLPTLSETTPIANDE